MHITSELLVHFDDASSGFSFCIAEYSGSANFPEVICVYVASLSPESGIDIIDYSNVLAN